MDTNRCLILVAVVTITGLVSFAMPASAAVAFNTFQISYTSQTNYDLALLDARNITAGGSFSTSQSDHDNGVSANSGDEIEFQIYYHNSAVPGEVAANVIIKASLPGGSNQVHEVSASIDSDQTSPVSSADAFRGGNIKININGSPQTLNFVSGSTRHFPNRSTTSQTLSNGDNVVGSGVNIGSVDGCFDFSGFVTFRARVGQAVSNTYDLSITKRVLNVTRSETSYLDSTNANPGDRLRFEVRFSTSGNASQNNVILRDILPGQLLYQGGTLREDGVSVSYESEFRGSGRNFGTLSAGTSRTITFEALVAGASSFSGNTTVYNTANVRSDQVGTKQDDVPVYVSLMAGVQFTLRKTAFNLTQGFDATSVSANPGDIITYTLYYKNTGQTTIYGAVIEDSIHDVLELAQITNQGGATSVNSVIKYPPVDVVPGVEIAKTFQVKVMDASLFPASSDLVMVNIYGNEVRVPVRKPQVKGVTTPPRTGATEWIVVALAGLTTAGYWLFRRRLITNN